MRHLKLVADNVEPNPVSSVINNPFFDDDFDPFGFGMSNDNVESTGSLRFKFLKRITKI